MSTVPAPRTVTPDYAHDDGSPLRCRCGIRVVTRYESKGTVHFDHAHDIDLPPSCEEAASLLTTYALADETGLPAVNIGGAPLTSCRVCTVPIYAVAALGADADLCADHRAPQPDPSLLARRATVARHTQAPPASTPVPAYAHHTCDAGNRGRPPR